MASAKPFQSLAVNRLPSDDLLEKTQFLPRYRYTKSGERVDNITHWAVAQFAGHYASSQSTCGGEVVTQAPASDDGGASDVEGPPTTVPRRFPSPRQPQRCRLAA